MINAVKVFFVDPMSYSGLALYDYSLLSNLKDVDLHFFGNTKYTNENTDVSISRIYDYSDKFFVFKLLSYISTQRKLFALIKKERPQVVHFQWLKIPAYDYKLLKRTKKLGIKVVFTAHNILPHESGDKYAGIYEKIYALVDIVIVHSEKTKNELIQKYDLPQQKIRVVPHGILNFTEVDVLKVQTHITNFKETYKIEDQVTFAVLGAISAYKGVDIVVDSWKSALISNNTNMKLIVAGSGRFDKLEDLKDIDNAIVINRFLETEEFMALLKIADYVLLPYRKISQSGVLLTALQEKKRVIVSDVGGLTDPFEFGNIGYILNNLTPEELTTTILRAYNEFENGRPDDEIWDTIFSHYDWKHIGQMTKKIYQSLV